MFLKVAVIFAGPVLSQKKNTDTPKIQTIRGQIVSLDVVASTMNVRWFRNDFDEMVINIPLSCEIRKGSEQIGISDLHFRDEVRSRFL